MVLYGIDTSQVTTKIAMCLVAGVFSAFAWTLALLMSVNATTAQNNSSQAYIIKQQDQIIAQQDYIIQKQHSQGETLRDYDHRISRLEQWKASLESKARGGR
jgi:uncharacterized protein (DUF3084 family)